MSAPASTPASPSRTTLGLVLIGIGLVLTLDTAGVLRTAGLGRWWPLLLMGVGIVKVRQPREDGQRAAGVAFLMVGSLFLLTSILTFGSAWALLMMTAGVFLLWQGVEGPGAQATVVSEAPYLSDMALIGVLKRRHQSQQFRGGSVTAVMGGVELDLRPVSVVGGTAVLDVVAFWGGIDIKIPAAWAVDARVVPIVGAFDNRADDVSAPGAPRLVIRGHAIMGAVVIRS